MKTLAPDEELKSNTPYIGFVDLIGKGNVKLTISAVDDVSGEKVDGVRAAKPCTYALSFKEVPGRKLLIQGKKKKFLMRQYGKKASDLIGKVVEIYGDPHVKFGGVEVGGVKFVGMEPEKGGAE
jgi:hypothetical protein